MRSIFALGLVLEGERVMKGKTHGLEKGHIDPDFCAPSHPGWAVAFSLLASSWADPSLAPVSSPTLQHSFLWSIKNNRISGIIKAWVKVSRFWEEIPINSYSPFLFTYINIYLYIDYFWTLHIFQAGKTSSKIFISAEGFHYICYSKHGGSLLCWMVANLLLSTTNEQKWLTGVTRRFSMSFFTFSGFPYLGFQFKNLSSIFWTSSKLLPGIWRKNCKRLQEISWVYLITFQTTS